MDSIQHDPQNHRFVTQVEGHEGYLEYEPGEGVMTITHTIVPAAIGGRGIAGGLVRAALEHARAKGLRVRPACSYADSWMGRHPEYADLRS